MLDGFEIPYFHDAVELAKVAHTYFYGLDSIGWDIAFTNDGPMIVEGNDDWDGVIAMTLDPDFRAQFEQFFNGRN